MEKKLLLFDLDGTLLNSEKKISKRTWNPYKLADKTAF